MADAQQELEQEFWEKLDDSPFVMLGLNGSGFTRPMTAQIDKQQRIYFFASRTEDLVKNLGTSAEAIATFASKGHDFFASMQGRLLVDNDRAKIDELWSPRVAAWYDKGKDDPELVLLRFDGARADLWEASAGSALKAAWMKLTGSDSDEHTDDQRAEVAL